MPTDLDLHCLQRQSISGFCRTRVKTIFGVSSYQWGDLNIEYEYQKRNHFRLAVAVLNSAVVLIWSGFNPYPAEPGYLQTV